MADILDYPQNTTPADGDALYIVDDPSGTPADEYVKLSDLYDGVRDGIDRDFEIVLIDSSTNLSTGDGFSNIPFVIPSVINGYNLIAAHAAVTGASTAGLPLFQVYNVTQTADMLTTGITIDVGEFTSYTALNAAEIDTANDDVATGDILRFDCDEDGSTGAVGAIMLLTFGKP